MFLLLWIALLAFLGLLICPMLNIVLIAWVSFITFLLSYYINLSIIAIISLYLTLTAVTYGTYYYQNDQIRKAAIKAVPGQSLLSTHFTLEKAILSGKGTANLHGMQWVLHGPDLPAGSLVTIMAVIEGILIVEEHVQ